ncbi:MULTISPECIES: hypothetical protein [unclassified Corynebacterium]|uniref:hypothetical protein n=1 Tax=unclassified Corynebacterium TaxID=2624378 RepID=UPI0008A3C37A|nr:MULTISPECIES: hypothetical protein [unclassified Corynebacterium]MCG7268021.1 hypothetical protein [Corynebacterium sp. ACRQJ]OFT36873.1 hypothetical protein HMPREF3166_00280 [Corynebacterium sp. HMSC08A12]
MNLKGFQLDTFLALVMVLGSAAFLGVGRMLFGALGWYMLVTIPLSFVFAVALYALWKVPVRIDAEDSSGVSHKVFDWRESWALIIVSTFLVLTGFFLVDFDDTDHGTKSMFTVLVGRQANKVSEVLCLLSFVGAILSYIVALVVAVRGRKASQD